MSERPLEPGAQARGQAHDARRRARSSRSSSRSSTCTPSRTCRRPARLELNDLAVVRLRLAEPLAVDPYERDRGDRRVHPDRRGDERHRRGRDGARGIVTDRAHADPYRDLAVIDSRAPRFNQAVVGVVSVLAVATGWWWLLALLALQLALGLTLGRRFCLPCLVYFGLIQPRFGEGPLEDSRPPRAANMVGFVVPRGRVARLRRRRPERSAALLGAARRRARAARGDDRLLHRLRGLQARLPPHRPAVRLLPDPGASGLRS